MRFCRVLGFVLAIFVASTGVAQAIPLSDLLQGGTISAGDKTFGDFAFSCTTGDCVGQGITPANIQVTASFANNTGYLQFSGNMISSTLVDFVLRYTVTASAGVINMIDQSFQLSSTGNGGAVVIAEDVRSGSFVGPILANSSIGFAFGIGDFQDPDPEVGDDLVLNPAQTKAWVTKDINLRPNAGGLVGTSVLIQSFHQQVPEPTSLLLLGTGLAGLAVWRKRSK